METPSSNSRFVVDKKSLAEDMENKMLPLLLLLPPPVLGDGSDNSGWNIVTKAEIARLREICIRTCLRCSSEEDFAKICKVIETLNKRQLPIELEDDVETTLRDRCSSECKAWDGKYEQIRASLGNQLTNTIKGYETDVHLAKAKLESQRDHHLANWQRFKTNSLVFRYLSDVADAEKDLIRIYLQHPASPPSSAAMPSLPPHQASVPPPPPRTTMAADDDEVVYVETVLAASNDVNVSDSSHEADGTSPKRKKQRQVAAEDGAEAAEDGAEDGVEAGEDGVEAGENSTALVADRSLCYDKERHDTIIRRRKRGPLKFPREFSTKLLGRRVCVKDDLTMGSVQQEETNGHLTVTLDAVEGTPDDEVHQITVAKKKLLLLPSLGACVYCGLVTDEDPLLCQMCDCEVHLACNKPNPFETAPDVFFCELCVPKIARLHHAV